MKNYNRKVYLVTERHGWQCVSCKKAMAGELGHCRIGNSKWARKKYPLFIDSIENLMPQCNYCNSYADRSYGRWPEYRVMEWEKIFENDPKRADFANGEMVDFDSK